MVHVLKVNPTAPSEPEIPAYFFRSSKTVLQFLLQAGRTKHKGSNDATPLDAAERHALGLGRRQAKKGSPQKSPA